MQIQTVPASDGGKRALTDHVEMVSATTRTLASVWSASALPAILPNSAASPHPSAAGNSSAAEKEGHQSALLLSEPVMNVPHFMPEGGRQHGALSSDGISGEAQSACPDSGLDARWSGNAVAIPPCRAVKPAQLPL